MALIKCISCKAKISNKATHCPKCGNPQFVICEECKNDVSVYLKGDCPECGNPDIQNQIDDYFAEQEQIDNDAATELQHNSTSNTDDEIKLRLFVGLYFSLLVPYWATEGFARHSLLELFPISLVLFVSGVLFPKVFGIITFFGIFFYLYQVIIQYYMLL
ncbi:hypothetical protein [Candidatus Albibeggiatoa sp. nov. BB20]|uniref:hypothetical protein n=1 Tax=Candidatus Albibeggiatoa sp. nov. BB20 TaxID=3162723 RepID=UPI0033657298